MHPWHIQTLERTTLLNRPLILASFSHFFCPISELKPGIQINMSLICRSHSSSFHFLDPIRHCRAAYALISVKSLPATAWGWSGKHLWFKRAQKRWLGVHHVHNNAFVPASFQPSLWFASISNSRSSISPFPAIFLSVSSSDMSLALQTDKAGAREFFQIFF